MNADDPEEILFWMGVYATDCKIKGKRVNTEIIKHYCTNFCPHCRAKMEDKDNEAD